ncbi:MAG: phosphocholine cytidylyltransferase family protein [Gammaproteobacteria bacterium]|jgi:choline kinase|nr:phosphocholine cytidylyltransferase family protein [Gammaproteobacteria bacterium]|tara:strand:+ start:106788 stop:107522 length:735 start_codon:yes stop_codon:yes gene_type:complete
MKAIILSAGQGRRLLPYTKSTPKCLLELSQKPFIQYQIDTLLGLGVDEIVVVVGYAATDVEQVLRKNYDSSRVRTLYNPFYEVADNLASCWMAREELHGEFMILNGDTLFEAAIIEKLIRADNYPITLASDEKPAYDDDDMKISHHQGRILRIGKKLPLEQVNAESIGAMKFSSEGATLFRDQICHDMHQPEALSRWYLSVIDELAASGNVGTISIQGLDWTELDFVHDLELARAMVSKWAEQG